MRHDATEDCSSLLCSAIRPSPTPCSPGSSTMPTASPSRETACERLLPSAPTLTPPRNPERNHHADNDPAAFIGTGGPLPSERVAAFNRNPWPQSSESLRLQIGFASQSAAQARRGTDLKPD